MKKFLISILVITTILSLVVEGHADPIYLTAIPIRCEIVAGHLKNIATPKEFIISVFKAHELAIKASSIIKPCASKLEQVIYFDNKYYYFTNSVLIHKGQPFPNIFVRVDGLTGQTTSTF
jgi:hypothetical protein